MVYDLDARSETDDRPYAVFPYIHDAILREVAATLGVRYGTWAG